jgi:membrane-bound ClpP family serine protease
MRLGKLITGLVLVAFGSVLIFLPLFLGHKLAFIMLIYGIPLFIIGVFILFNKEDEIEKIKVKGGKHE